MHQGKEDKSHPFEKVNRLNIHKDIIYQSQVNKIAWEIVRKVTPEYHEDSLKEGLILTIVKLNNNAILQ